MPNRPNIEHSNKSGAGSSRRADEKPNIVFIMADDLGYADLSCCGQRDYATPCIDRLASEGLRFMQGYANSPVCSATRTALMTGRYQYRLPVGLEEPINRSTPKDVGLPPDHPNLVSLLNKAGYRTALVGKWHLGYLPDFSPLRCGYDRFFGIIGGAADYFNHGANALHIDGEASRLYEQEVPVERQGYMTDLLGARAVELIETYAKSSDPFFLSLHFTAPHWPWEGPDDEAESRRIQDLFHWDGGSQKIYSAMVRNMDANVGKALAALESAQCAHNTIVVFTSDNGGERFSKTWPFTGMKTELLEGGLRIPCLVRWPDRISAGSVSEQVMISMDWAPTLLAAAGLEMDPAYPADGCDLLPHITSATTPQPRKLYWRYKAGAQRAVRDGDWKYLSIAGNEFLFDVVRDPRERANLKDRRSDIFEPLKADWETWNENMLPDRPGPARHYNTGDRLADHYGISNPQFESR